MSGENREANIDDVLTQKRRALAETWRRALARTNFVPLGAQELRSAFDGLAGMVLSGLLTDGDAAECGRELGAALVGVGYTLPAALGSSLALLSRELQPVAPIHDARLAELLSGIATGFSAASRARLLDDQEATRRAVLDENRRAGEAIRRQAALLELAPDAILVRGLDGRILFWNRGAETLYGWSREEALGKVVHELLQTIFPAPRQTIESMVLANGRWEGELAHTCRDGASITSSSRWACQLDAHGHPEAFLEINTDITARKRMETQLLERELSLETAQAIAHLGSWDFNLRTGETHWSPEAHRLLGYAEGEVQPSLDAYLQAVHPDDLPLVQRAVQDAIQGNSYPFEFRAVIPGEDPRILQSQSEAVMDASGNPQSLFGTILDVTERKRAESERMQLFAAEAARAEAEAARNRAALLASASAQLAMSLDYEQTLQTVAEVGVPALADACTVDILDETGELARVAAANAPQAPAAQLQGVWSSAAASETLSRVIRDGDSAVYAELADLADQVDGDCLAELQATGIRSILIAPLPARGRVLGAITWFAFETRAAYADVERALAEDIAQRAGLALDNARLHAEARRATSLRDEFLSVAAHELKTPMTTLRGYTQLLAKSSRSGDIPTSGMLERSVKNIETQSRKLSKLTEQLLDVSRLETGKLPINPARVDLVELVQAVVQSVQQTTDRHRIETYTPERCLVEADPMRLEQVLANLLDNAVKYSPDGGRVRVELAELNPDWVEISVRDWGLGIPLQRRENLFDRFYQAHSEGHYGGLGLGLYVSRQIIELHAGSIRAEFPDDGGSLFAVQLPLASQRRV